MPNPNTNFKDSNGVDLGTILITKEYLLSVYPQIAAEIITPELWVWGRNESGHLGINTVTDRCTPVTTFAGGANWKQVASAGNFITDGHVAAIKTDGTLWTWGANNAGKLGNNTTTQRNTPVTTLVGGSNWKQVACGGRHTAAIKTDGTLWTWGSNDGGKLGDNTVTQRLTPVTTFTGGNNWKQVACGYSHTAAIKTDGTLWVWGDNNKAQLGDNTIVAKRTPIQTFAGGTNWKQVACGGYHYTAAIKTDGTLWVWGDNGNGQLGINTVTTRSTPVQTFAGGTNWKQVACGYLATAAIKTDGTLWTWGENSSGALGNNSTDNRSTPVTTFSGGTNWKQVAISGISFATHHTAAIKTDGTLWVWGSNDFGQLGIFVGTSRSTPVTTFAGGTNWKQVACGKRQIAAIKTSDNLLGI